MGYTCNPGSGFQNDSFGSQPTEASKKDCCVGSTHRDRIIRPAWDFGSKRRKQSRNGTQNKSDPADKTAIFGSVWVKVNREGFMISLHFNFGVKRNIEIYGNATVV